MTNITVIGTGYVGLMASACFAEMGHRVICVDTGASKLDDLLNGHVPFHEPGLQTLVANNLKTQRLGFTASLADPAADCCMYFSHLLGKVKEPCKRSARGYTG